MLSFGFGIVFVVFFNCSLFLIRKRPRWKLCSFEMPWLPNILADHIISVSAKQLHENFPVFHQIVHFNSNKDLEGILFVATGFSQGKAEVMHSSYQGDSFK